ncbi:NAD(P)/FAD-dependent oxidoreductase [Aurantivibrio plasticivorans]
MSKTCIVIGASHAGSQLALSLRQEGWEGPILLIGEESVLPYQRPPLSKSFLSGAKSVEELYIRPKALYEKQQVEVLLNSRVTHIDGDNKSLTYVKDGEEKTLQYDKIALCTGAHPRHLSIPGSELEGIHYLRTLNDVEKIRSDLEKVQSHKSALNGVIVGGGYIGLETAAMLNAMGHQMTVLEAMPQLLSRVAAPEIGKFYNDLHQAHGVDIRTECHVNGFTEHGDRVEAVVLSDGSKIDADFVIVGIGVQVNGELADQLQLKQENGIVVDNLMHTSNADVVAAGDCTRFHNDTFGSLRLESVPNATEQAKTAAASLCNKEKPYHALPWFWSDQYDCKLQIAGISAGYTDIVVRGVSQVVKDEKPSFSVFYFSDDKLIAADCINRPKDFMFAKRWLTDKTIIDKTTLADDDMPLS